MAKKERLGSDPFKESLDWIHDTREEKKESKESKKEKPKTLKSFSVKASKQDKVKESELKKRHTIYLSSSQSKKLRIYAADNDMQLSEIIEKLINENI